MSPNDITPIFSIPRRRARNTPPPIDDNRIGDFGHGNRLKTL
jgi:hypothetical protein